MYDLPTTVTVGDNEYTIRNNGDYRTIISIIDVASDHEFNDNEKMVTAIIMFYEDVNDIADVYYTFPDMVEAYNAIMRFISMNNTNVGNETKHKLIDWVQDEQLITSAINNVAGTEIRALPYLHWWTFIGYYMAVGESALSTVVGIRSKLAEHKKLAKHELKFKRDNPQYFMWENDLKRDQQIISQIWEG